MSKKILFLIAVFITATSFAQQQGINYKALIKDASGNVLINTSIRIQFSIRDNPSDQFITYSEEHVVDTDANGIVIVNIGTGNQTSEDDGFSELEWDTTAYYLDVEVDISGGTNYVFMGTTQFMAVPYAKHANTATIATTALNAGATNINGLSDGKSDTNGSSLFLGIDAGTNDDGTDNRNVGVGYQALNLNTTGVFNTANGYQALNKNTTGNYNTANGALALSSNIEGIANTANGFWSLFLNTTGSSNTANGYAALYTNTTGSNNTANGLTALFSNTTGSDNTANGYKALNQNIIGDGNVALGYRAGYSETGSDKLYIANSDTNTPLIYGDFVTEILTINGGFQVTGDISETDNAFNVYKDGRIVMGKNPIVGTNHLLSIGEGSDLINPKNALTVYSSGSTNLFTLTNIAGLSSFAPSNDAFVVKQNGNIEMGNYYTSGNNQILTIGNGSQDLFGITRSNALTVYNGTEVGLSDNSGYVMIGNNDEANLIFDTQGIMARNNGATADLHLQIEGGALFIGGDIVNNSDRRLKKDIEDLPYGLKEILQLQPKAYNWKNRTQEHKSLGLIAQDVQPLIKEIVTAQDDEVKTLGISYTELIPILINAIKEQQAIIMNSESRITNYETEVNGLKNRLEKIEALLVNNKEEIEVVSTKK